MTHPVDTAAGPALPARTVVLLVDDQPIIGEAVRRMLAGQADLEFKFCPDALAAVATAVELKPTVILQDLMMPGKDGLDLVREYRERPETRDIPLIVLSAKEEATTKAEAFARGANDYLVKLPDPIEMIARIRHHSRGYIALLERNEAFARLAESERHMASELQTASRYVQSLLDPPVDEARVRTQWVFIPSAQLGGDTIGHFWIDANHFAFYVIDVCGHGVGPALLSVSAMSLIRSLPPDEAADPKTVLERLNANFPMTRHNGMYFTMWYGVYDVARGEVTWSGAGHPPAVLIRPDGSHERLDSQGMMIGVLPEYENPNDTRPVARGDRFYLYSDGIFEIQQPDGTMWNLDECLAELVAPCPGSRVEKIRTLTARVRGRDEYDDDYSIMEVEIR
jgi:sigma-B regulation protein RsbU (phosphoserine phosphatase)